MGTTTLTDVSVTKFGILASSLTPEQLAEFAADLQSLTP